MASSTQPVAPSIAPDASLVLFARGVIARLMLWPALRLAVDESWGGPESAQKRTWMASVIVDAFDPAESQETPDDYYVEDMLLQIMSDEFDTVLEDGSAEAVAKDIVRLWDNLADAQGKQLVDGWESQVQKVKGTKVASQRAVDENADSEEESGSDDDEDNEGDGGGMDIDEAPQLIDRQETRKREKPEVDEDGFTLVKGKGKGHGAG